MGAEKNHRAPTGAAEVTALGISCLIALLFAGGGIFFYIYTNSNKPPGGRG